MAQAHLFDPNKPSPSYYGANEIIENYQAKNARLNSIIDKLRGRLTDLRRILREDTP